MARQKTEIYVNNQDGTKVHVENITINNTCERRALIGLFLQDLPGAFTRIVTLPSVCFTKFEILHTNLMLMSAFEVSFKARCNLWYSRN